MSRTSVRPESPDLTDLPESRQAREAHVRLDEPRPPSGLAGQMGIYQAKFAGKTPELPVAVEDLEQKARSVLSPEAFDYVAGGAGMEDTLRANLAAFRRWRLVPRSPSGRRQTRARRRDLRPSAPLADPARADRRPGYSSSRGRTRLGPGGGLDGRSAGGQHGLVPTARGGRGRDGPTPRGLVSALLAPERRTRREPPRACPASRLRGPSS